MSTSLPHTASRIAGRSRKVPRSYQRGSRWDRIPSPDLVDVTRHLAVMIGAKVPLLQALETVEQQNTHRGARAVLAAVRKSVERGQTLSHSLKQHPRSFGQLYVALTQVGERAGVLDVVYLRLSEHLEKAAALRRKIRLAFMYPGLILTVALGATFFFLTAIVPTFAEIFQDFGAALPRPTQVVLRVSEVMSSYGLVALVVGLLGWGGLYIALRQPRGRYLWDRVKLRLPLVGTLLRKSLVTRFCQTLGTLLTSGVPLVEALTIVGQSVENTFVQRQLVQAVARVRRGAGIHKALASLSVFPTMVIQMVAVGEETAQLDQMLLHAATHYEREVDTAVETLTAVLEPVLIIVIGAGLGGILVALYLPMFEMMNVVA